MTARLATIVDRAPTAALLACLLFTVGIGAYAVGVPDRLALGGGTSAGSESEDARALLAAELGYDPAAAFVLALSSEESISAPSSDVAIKTLIGQVESLPQVAAVELGKPSADGLTTTLSVFVGEGTGSSDLEAVGSSLAGDLDPGPLSLLVDGPAATEIAARDVAGDEAPKLIVLALPLLLLLLAASLGWRMAPAVLLAAALAAAGAVAALGALGEVVEIAVISVVAAALGGAVLAVEFGSGLLYRYREEAASLGEGTEAIEYSLHTVLKGAAIGVVSAALVGAGLMVIPIEIVRSIGAGVIAASLFGPLLGVIPVAAAISLGAASGSGASLPLASADTGTGGAPFAFRYLLALARGRGRGLIALLPIVVLAALALPLLDSEAIGLQADELPAGDPAVEADSRLAGAFGAGVGGPLLVLTDGPAEAPTVTTYRDSLSRIESVRSVGRGLTAGEFAAIDVVADSGPTSLGAQRTLERVRAEPAPSPSRVGGPAAELADSADRLVADLPLVGLLALLGTAALWSLLFRSAFGPLLALTGAIAPLAGVAAMLLVFSDGRLSGALDYTPAGAPHLYTLVVVAALLLAIGLARGAAFATALREERALGGGAAGSIARSGLLTLMPAALATGVGVVLAGVWVGSEVLAAKELAVGLSAGLLADLVLARAVLAPALARLSI